MQLSLRRLIGAVLILAALTAASGVSARPSARERAAVASRYLVSRQHPDGSFPGFSPVGSTADAVIALVAARRAPGAVDEALEFLATTVDGATLGQKAKVVLAVVAAGGDPRAFGGHDLVAEIEAARQPDGSYGEEGDLTAVTTHALAALALAAAGQPIDDPAVDWLVAAQCPDGGWQYDEPHQEGEDEHCYDATAAPDGSPSDFTTSDTNTTSYAVQAIATHHHPVDLPADPFGYFSSARDRVKNGYRYSHDAHLFGTRAYTDANSTALVLQSFAAMDRTPPRGAKSALAALQYPRLCGKVGGAFAYTWEKRDGRLERTPSRRAARAEATATPEGSTVAGATIGAIPGLLLRPLPVEPVAALDPVPRRRAC